MCRECIECRNCIDANVGEKKCGIIIAKVAFCITNTPTKLNVGDYDNTKIEYIIFQSTVFYGNIQYIPKKSIGNILYILNCSFYLIKIKFDIFDINVIGLNSLNLIHFKECYFWSFKRNLNNVMEFLRPAELRL